MNKRKKVVSAVLAITLTLFSVLGNFPAAVHAQDQDWKGKYIHLNALDGDDQNDGLTADTSVKTFERAKALIDDGDIILVDREIEITQDETWDLSDKPNARLQRNTGGPMIEIAGAYTLTLNHVVIDGENYNSAGGQSQEIISLGKLAGGKENGASLVLNSGTVLENNSNANVNGGAIAGYSYNTITMNEGAVIRNNGTTDLCADFGGAISLENHGRFVMNGGTIDNNHAIRGGGVSLIASSMEMNGGVISNNSANSKNTYSGHYGGGIYLSNFQDWSHVGDDNSRDIAGEASFVMNGGTITKNQATYASGADKGLGGAIATFPRYDKGFQTDPKILIDLNGGTLSENTAISGGAISAYFEATRLDISDTDIIGNKAQEQGGAVYGVFGTQINSEGAFIADNEARVGGGIYLHSSELRMTSGEISGNRAASQGGGICIASAAYNKKTAECTLLGGIVKENTADAGRGSDGIYQGSILNIGEKALIHEDNDVYLPSGRVINAIQPLESIDSQNPVSITSEDCVVESETEAGTPLVHYYDEAGGIRAAMLAEHNQIYLPSGYMREGLVIGKSMADSQQDYMTYVDKKKYPVAYEFVSGTEGKELPVEVDALLPTDEAEYFEGAIVTSIAPERTTVSVPEGTWEFQGYDADEKTAAENLKFTGVWKFQEKTGGITTEDKTEPKSDGSESIKTWDKTEPGRYLATAAISGLLFALFVVLRKKNM